MFQKRVPIYAYTVYNVIIYVYVGVYTQYAYNGIVFHTVTYVIVILLLRLRSVRSTCHTPSTALPK